MHFGHRGSLAVTAAVIWACTTPPDRIVIGVPDLRWARDVVPLVEEDIARLAFDPAVEILVGPLPTSTEIPSGDAAVRLAEHFAGVDGIVAVVGHGGSRESLFAAPVYADHEIIQVVPTGTSRQLAGVSPWTFPLAPNDSLEGAYIAAYVERALGARTVAVFYTNDQYGTGLRDGVAEGLAAVGGSIVYAAPVNAESDFGVAIEAMLLRQLPDAVVVAGRPRESLGIARALHSARPGLPVIAGDGTFVRREIVSPLRTELASLHIVGFWHPDLADSASQRFAMRFRDLHGTDPDASNALAYDAFTVLLSAIREVGPRPRVMRGYLLALGDQRPVVAGVTGPLAFGPARASAFVIVRLGDREVVLQGVSPE